MTSPKGETLIVKNEERRVSFKSYCSSQAVNKTCITPWWLSDAVWSVSLLSAILLLWGGLASIWYHQAGCWSQRGGGAGCVPILLNRGRQRTGNMSHTRDISKRYVFIKPYTKTRSHFCVVLKATQTHLRNSSTSLFPKLMTKLFKIIHSFMLFFHRKKGNGHKATHASII